MKRVLFLISAILLSVSTLGYALEVPVLKARVNDYGSMISPGTASHLENILKDFEASDSTQVVILTVESLQGDSMEDFTIRVAEKWKIGQKGKDNGVILFASKNDRKMRIETGRGLEGVLTDLMAGRILDNVISPKFRAGDFDEGFTAGIEAIIQVCRGEFTSDQVYESDSFLDGIGDTFFGLITLIIILGAGSFFRFLGRLLGTKGCLITLIIFAGVFFFFKGFVFDSIFTFLLIVFFIIFVIIFSGGMSGSSSGGGWSSDSGGSSGGGFSGGGGSFGGGGASGGW